MDAMRQFSTEEAARILHASEPRVRTWARMGGVVPRPGSDGRPQFTFQQLLLLRTTRGLLESGVSPRRIRRIWTSLRRQLTDDRPLTSIRILASGNRAVAWDGTAPWQPDSGQFLLDFDAESVKGHAGSGEAPRAAESQSSDATIAMVPDRPKRAARVAEVLPLRPDGVRGDGATWQAAGPERLEIDADRTNESADSKADATLSAEQWFHLGCELESSSPLEARQAYLQAIDADPEYADAHLNLGRLDHKAGALGSAEARYRRAIECDPQDATAHFNLGVLLEDRQCPQAAADAYARAIECDPDFADAHYNLGLVLDELGRRAEAMQHLIAAHRLYTL
ncbi:MAG: tetratricopeptide repeat protein [Bacteroidota bacterium]